MTEQDRNWLADWRIDLPPRPVRTRTDDPTSSLADEERVAILGTLEAARAQLVERLMLVSDAEDQMFQATLSRQALPSPPSLTLMRRYERPVIREVLRLVPELRRLERRRPRRRARTGVTDTDAANII